MKEQVQTQSKVPTAPMPAPPVSVFQTRSFGAQSDLDESPSLGLSASNLFDTYLQRRTTDVGHHLGTPSTSPIIQPKLTGTAQREAGTVGEGIGGSGLYRENNTGLPDNLKSGIESLSGMAMDDVRVHYNSSKPAELQALAYAQGSDIHVGPGQERHLPHEAWHVVQQKQGRVNPTMQMKGVGINDDRRLEKEADVMGARAMQQGHVGQIGLPATSHDVSVQATHAGGLPIQGKFVGELAPLMKLLKPEDMKLKPDHIYSQLWQTLNDSNTNLKIEQGQRTSYVPKDKTLYAKGEMLKELV